MSQHIIHCDLCGKEVLNGTVYTGELPNGTHVLMCADCEADTNHALTDVGVNEDGDRCEVCQGLLDQPGLYGCWCDDPERTRSINSEEDLKVRVNIIAFTYSKGRPLTDIEIDCKSKTTMEKIAGNGFDEKVVSLVMSDPSSYGKLVKALIKLDDMILSNRDSDDFVVGFGADPFEIQKSVVLATKLFETLGKRKQFICSVKYRDGGA